MLKKQQIFVDVQKKQGYNKSVFDRGTKTNFCPRKK